MLLRSRNLDSHTRQVQITGPVVADVKGLYTCVCWIHKYLCSPWHGGQGRFETIPIPASIACRRMVPRSSGNEPTIHKDCSQWTKLDPHKVPTSGDSESAAVDSLSSFGRRPRYPELLRLPWYIGRRPSPRYLLRLRQEEGFDLVRKGVNLGNARVRNEA